MYLLALLVCCAAGLVASGFIYQWLGAHNDRRRYASHGRWIDIGNGRKLYLLEKGSCSSNGNTPTVIFEAGIAATNLNWHHIQESVSRFAHTTSYDRCGLGWSSPSSLSRTPGNIVVELNSMLHAAGIKPPYIFVGHSFGGLVVRRYALMYPEEVQGIILIDPMRCEEWPPMDPSRQAQLDRGTKLAGIAVPIAQIGLARLAVTSLLCRSGHLSTFLAGAAGDGGKHVLSRIKGEVSKMPEGVWPIVAAHWSRPGYYVGMASHVSAVPDTVREMQNAKPILDTPILMLTPATSSPLDKESLARIGNNIQQVIALDSAHWIHLDQPDLVINSIREMVLSSERIAVTV
jgi:pimeloyl-ACP methyl ester carboxylesterase